MKRVLFVCVHNSGRSQMAEAFARHLAEGAVEVDSAGTIPSEMVTPRVIEVMKEKGIDVSVKKPKLLTNDMLDRADRVADLARPVITEDWGIDDPTGKPPDEVRRIRDDIEQKVRGLLQDANS